MFRQAHNYRLERWLLPKLSLRSRGVKTELPAARLRTQRVNISLVVGTFRDPPASAS